MFWKILDILRDLKTKNGPFMNVLDVGSRNINGSVRDVLIDSKVLGIDFIDGKDVDMIMNAHNIYEQLNMDNLKFDLITCCETLEHDDQFWLTVEAMRKLLKSGGWLFISTPGINFFKHDFPSDYYRFTEEVYKDVFFKGWNNIYVENYCDLHSEYVNKPNNIIGYAQKPL